MTRAGAVSTAQNAATRFGVVFVVYRLPGWPPDVFGCRKDDPTDGLNLPKEAVLFERCAPGGSATVHQAPTKHARPGQGGLLFDDAGDAPALYIIDADLEDDSEIGDI